MNVWDPFLWYKAQNGLIEKRFVFRCGEKRFRFKIQLSEACGIAFLPTFQLPPPCIMLITRHGLLGIVAAWKPLFMRVCGVFDP